MTPTTQSYTERICEDSAKISNAPTSTFTREIPRNRRLGQVCKSCGKRRSQFPQDKYGRPRTAACLICTGQQPDPDTRLCQCGAVLPPAKRKCAACLTPKPRQCATRKTVTGPFPVRRSDGSTGLWNADTATIRCPNPAAPKSTRCDACRMSDDPASSQCPFCLDWYITHNSSRYASQSAEHAELTRHATARCIGR